MRALSPREHSYHHGSSVEEGDSKVEPQDTLNTHCHGQRIYTAGEAHRALRHNELPGDNGHADEAARTQSMSKTSERGTGIQAVLVQRHGIIVP
jgi:hypothetical protein